MARRPYAITEADYIYARRYLDKKMDSPKWLGDNEQWLQATRNYQQFARQSPERLDEWCRQYLSLRHWTQLRCSIRSARRQRNRPRWATVSLTLSAWIKLKSLAERKGVTISEAVELYVGETR